MYEKLRLLFAIFCFVAIVRYGSAESSDATSEQTSLGTTAAMNTETTSAGAMDTATTSAEAAGTSSPPNTATTSAETAGTSSPANTATTPPNTATSSPANSVTPSPANTATTSAMVSGMTTGVPTTDQAEPWKLDCSNGTWCTYKLSAPATNASELSYIKTELTVSGNILIQQQASFNNTQQEAQNYENTVGGLIQQLLDIKENLTALLNETQSKLVTAKVELADINYILNQSQCILAGAIENNTCYDTVGHCSATCPQFTTAATTTAASTAAVTGTGTTVSVTMGTGSSGTMAPSTSAATNTPFTGSSAPTTSGGTTYSGATGQPTAAGTSASTTPNTGSTSTSTSTSTASTTTSTTPSGPTTTTQTGRPTPSNPCANKTCNGTVGYEGTCVVYPGNVAKCDCPGNLDPDSCGKVSCVSANGGGTDVTRMGPFWSPGFNGTSGTYGAVGASPSGGCQWKMTSPAGLYLNVTAIHFKTDNDARLEIQTNTGNGRTLSGDYSSLNYLLNERLKDTFQDANAATFTFTSSVLGSAPDYNFQFQFNFIPPASQPPA